MKRPRPNPPPLASSSPWTRLLAVLLHNQVLFGILLGVLAATISTTTTRWKPHDSGPMTRVFPSTTIKTSPSLDDDQFSSSPPHVVKPPLTHLKSPHVVCVVYPRETSTKQGLYLAPLFVNVTWGRRCDTLLFVHPAPSSPVDVEGITNFNASRLKPLSHLWYTEENAGVPPPAPTELWSKNDNPTWLAVKKTLAAIPRSAVERGDLFVFSDDASYVIPDNLRHLYVRGEIPSDLNFYGGRNEEGEGSSACDLRAFVLNRKAMRTLLEGLNAKTTGEDACDTSPASPGSPFSPFSTIISPSDALRQKLGGCFHSLIKKRCVDMRDFVGKRQFLNQAPTELFKSIARRGGEGERDSSDSSATARKDVVSAPPEKKVNRNCCTALPIAFMGIGKINPIRTGSFSFLYLYDYFIQRTAVAGREALRPRATPEAGINDDTIQIGF